MNTKEFFNVINELDNKYVEEAIQYKKKKSKTSVWVKWGTVAACFSVVAILGISMFQSGLFRNKIDVAILENGNEIVFVKSKMAISDLDINVTTRQLTQEESMELFPDLPVTAHAIFAEDKELVGFEGTIGSAKMLISTTDILLLDTEIAGSEESSEVNGISITAGYFITGRNAIYYATFTLGDSTVYVENVGAKEESERVKNDLAIIIQKLIDNGTLNLNSLKDDK